MHEDTNLQLVHVKKLSAENGAHRVAELPMAGAVREKAAHPPRSSAPASAPAWQGPDRAAKALRILPPVRTKIRTKPYMSNSLTWSD